MPQLAGCDYYPDSVGYLRVIRDPAEVEPVCRWVADQPVRFFDTETSGLEWWGRSRVVGVGLGAYDSDGQVRAWYLPFRHQTGERQLSEDLVVRAVRAVLAAPGTIVGHNLKFDEHMGRREGWAIAGERYDTMISSALFDENLPLELESRAKNHLGIEDPWAWDKRVQIEVAAAAKARGQNKTTHMDAHGYACVPVNCLGIYCCFDILHTALLYRFFEAQNVRAMFPRIWRTEMELVRILGDTEALGMAIDAPYLQGLRARLEEQIERLRKKWYALVGAEFDPASDDDIRRLVYQVYRATVSRLTRKSNKASVENDVLELLTVSVPPLQVLLPLRTAAKIKSTYCDNLLGRLDERSRCHPSFQQVGTNTGRLSCREPNFQNMPAESKERAEAHGGVDPMSIRRAFVVDDPNWPRWFFDYSQIELRVLAAYSRDPIMLDVYAHNGDIHDRTQKEVSALLQHQVERRDAKIVNFGLSYGLTAGGLSRQSGLPIEQAEKFMRAFFERYKGIAVFRERLCEQIRAHPQTMAINLWGRARRVPFIRSSNKYDRLRAERQAIGSLIQGTAAELTKESMVRIDALRHAGYPLRMVNTVHDEIQIEIERQGTAETVSAIKAEMERYPELAPVPVVVDPEFTLEHWAKKQKIPKEKTV